MAGRGATPPGWGGLQWLMGRIWEDGWMPRSDGEGSEARASPVSGRGGGGSARPALEPRGEESSGREDVDWPRSEARPGVIARQEERRGLSGEQGARRGRVERP